ncbi:DoxX family protein [Catenuloplanes atrovinosus]|uniref:DoxX family protein n=1 Tax=Catenuloplanes atrovinosus TaxID=137266 RepID=A0AAE4CBQ1_9ACTN|nr:DoxX family protein [Catenuloplanes atrovinosus]MDR7278277.1 hypothetical protein [Catenuloplanes atrovinosus]
MFAVVVVLSVLLVVVFSVAALRKARGGAELAAEAVHLGFPPGPYRLLGVLEAAGIAGLVIGLWWAPLGIAALAGFVAMASGAAIVHLRAGDPAPKWLLPLVVTVLAVAALVLRVLTA